MNAFSIASADKEQVLAAFQNARPGAWRLVDTWPDGERWQLPYGKAELVLRLDDGVWRGEFVEGVA